MSMYEGKVNAPDFPAGLDWLNVREPLSLASLRGKVVLLDFWTYCCINCMHVIPDLKKLEAKYPNQLVVIGVHSAKFQSERDTNNVLQAVLRHEIEHPVINDHEMAVWQQYTVRAWPTVVLIDTEGKVVGAHAGEGVFRAVDPIISQMVAGAAKESSNLIDPIARYMPQSLLSFPGKVLADEATDRLYIADTNHNRVVVTTLAGNVVDVIVGFDHPQGMCLLYDTLYVADTGSNSVIAVQGERFERVATGLNSPWDLTAHNGSVFVAMSGSHQIWKLDVTSRACIAVAGSGAEGLVDGQAATAALAQPSGITSDGKRIYFADSETSSIRMLDGDRVGTIVGTGLFDFGDRDGFGDDVRLQHPLGVVAYRDELFVADSYNGKIKVVKPDARDVRTLAGGFAEPGGLSIANGKVYVADTNNHVIRVIDLQNPAVTTLMLAGLERLKPPSPEGGWTGSTVDAGTRIVAPGQVHLALELKFPEGMKLNLNAPNRLLARADSTAVKFEGERPYALIQNPQSMPIEIPVVVQGSAAVKILAQIYYCHSGDEGLCFYNEILVSCTLSAAPESAATIVHLELPV